MTAEITRRGVLDMQVCVPEDWNDYQATDFAEVKNPCGTEHGWQVRREGSDLLNGAAERTPCDSRADHVHIMLDA